MPFSAPFRNQNIHSQQMNITNLTGTVALANGVAMPYLGLGVYKTPDGPTVVQAVTHALDAGYPAH